MASSLSPNHFPCFPQVRPRHFGWIDRAIAGTICLSLLCLSQGCAGYQVGTRSLHRPEIRTVEVPVFLSDSYRPNLGERLTEAVIKEIEKRSTYKVVSAPADSVLIGRLVGDRKQVIAETINDDPRLINSELGVVVTWTDRRGDIIMQSTIPLDPILMEFTQGMFFIPEAGQSVATAHQQAIEKLARQIVGRMEAPW